MFETQEERDQNLRIFKNMAETTEQFAPMFVSDLGGKTTAIVVPFEKPEDKEMFSKIIRVMILKEAITGFALAVESWMTNLPPGSKVDPQDLLEIPPEERPYTTECMMVVFSNGKGEHTYMARLDRVRGKRVLRDWELMPQSGLSGQFTNMWRNAKAVTN